MSRSDAGRTRTNPADVLAYFITFRTYGSWLHGSMNSSVNRFQNTPESPRIEASSAVRNRALDRMAGDAVLMTPRQQTVCTKAIQNLCVKRHWELHALNVRTNHVHAVISAPVLGERVMADVKAFATRALRKENEISADARMWAYHGSTHLLFDRQRVLDACRYVVEMQGERQGIVGSDLA